MDSEYKIEYSKVVEEVNNNTIVLWRMFCMKLTKRGEEWRLYNNDNYYPK